MNTEQIMSLAYAYGSNCQADGANDCSHPTTDKAEASLEAAIEQLVQERDDALYAGRLIVQRCDRLVSERDALKTLVANVHKAKGRYHSQIAMAALYEACGLPNVKPISGEKS